jgi:transcriptional regulatory protein RtcR
LHDLARGYPFDPDAEEYLVHITTGTHVAQICLFLRFGLDWDALSSRA